MFNNPFGLLSKFRVQQSANAPSLWKKESWKTSVNIFLLFSIFLYLLTACANGTNAKPMPTPEADKGHVIGTIQSPDGKPYSEFSIRIADVYWQGDEGAYVLDESFSPGAVSDENGSFQILNAPMGDYVLIISGPLQKYQPVSDANGVLKRVKVNAGETVDLGIITFEYKP